MRFSAPAAWDSAGRLSRRRPGRGVTGPCATPDSIAFRGQTAIPEGDLAVGRRDRRRRRRSARGRLEARDQRPLRDEQVRVRHQYDVRDHRRQVASSSSTSASGRVLSDVKVVGPDKVSLELGARSRRSPDRQADRPGAGREGRRAHRLALPERGLLPRQGHGRHGSSAGRTRRRSPSTSTKAAASRSSGVEVVGNKALPTRQIVGAISTKPEGFFWWRNGEFDSDKYAEDLAQEHSRSCTRRTATSTCRS